MAVNAATASRSLKELTDEEFVHAYLIEHINGELEPRLKQRYSQIIENKKNLDLVGEYTEKRGKLQLHLQDLALTPDDIHNIRNTLYDGAADAFSKKDDETIQSISKSELRGEVLRIGVGLAIVVGILWAGFALFMPEKDQSFDPVQTLGYEAAVLEQDPKDRLDFPSESLADVTDFLAKYPGLDFQPIVFQGIQNDWQVNGASLIDYETAKISVVQYTNLEVKDNVEEKMFVFSFNGKADDLPRTEKGKLDGLVYYTYASDELNMVIFVAQKDLLGVVVGRRSAPELAGIAKAGLSQN